jgi:hypothetical protein
MPARSPSCNGLLQDTTYGDRISVQKPTALNTALQILSHDFRSVFNKGGKALDSPHVGHVVRETDDKIVVFGHYDYRFDIPKSEIIAVVRKCHLMHPFNFQANNIDSLFGSVMLAHAPL